MLNVETLAQTARESKAAKHPIYEKFRNLKQPENVSLLRDYLVHYGCYSKTFIPALIKLIEKAPQNIKIDAIKDNLEEEQGDRHEVGYKALPHDQMYELFLKDFHNHFGFVAESETPITEAMEWANFTKLLEEKSFAFGVGALGLATELILSNIFQCILDGLRKVENFDAKSLYFFELHAECDEKHGDDFVSLAREIANSSRDFKELKDGTEQMLKFRQEFCDAIFVRNGMH
jgi:pyrroloquinoline quinone (PQQ) biosynthesis protein C